MNKKKEFYKKLYNKLSKKYKVSPKFINNVHYLRTTRSSTLSEMISHAQIKYSQFRQKTGIPTIGRRLHSKDHYLKQITWLQSINEDVVKDIVKEKYKAH